MSGERLISRCSKCGFVYRPNVTGSAPIVCGCGVPFVMEVTFALFSDGGAVVVEGAERDWDQLLGPDVSG
jgi:hypothetical protein